MSDVSSRKRRRSVLRNRMALENKAFKKFKKTARYGSKLHRHRISVGVLTNLYGRPIRSKYKQFKKPRRVAGYRSAARSDSLSYYRRLKSGKRKRYAR